MFSQLVLVCFQIYREVVWVGAMETSDGKDSEVSDLEMEVIEMTSDAESMDFDIEEEIDRIVSQGVLL